MNAIPIRPFQAEYRVNQMNAKAKWYPCTVVGVDGGEGDLSTGLFTIITIDDEGVMYAGNAEAVRRAEED